MKKNTFTLKKILSIITTAMLALPTFAQEPSSPLAGFSVRDGKLLDAYGKPFIFRGVTIDHTLAPEKTLQAIRDVAATGANSAQIEIPIGYDTFPRTVVAQLREIIAECKANKLVCVLEPNDAAGYPDYSPIHGAELASLWTWQDLLPVLEGNQGYIILGFGNQHFSGGPLEDYKYRMPIYVEALLNNLPAGFVVMIDGDNWAEDTSKLMFEFAKNLKTQSSDLSKRIIYSVDMFYSYLDPNKVHDYIASFNELGAPLVVGGFAPVPYYHPYRPTPLQTDAPQLPAASVMQYAEQYGAGYFGWSWSGNKNAGLDVVTDYDANALTNWGKLLFNGANGIKATAKRASIYGNVSSSSSSSSAPNRPPVANFDVFNYPVTFCSSPNPGKGRITATAKGSSDPDGDALTYSWLLSGGIGESASGYEVFLGSESGKAYQLTLTVTDSKGASTSITKSVPRFYLDCFGSSSSSMRSSSVSSSLSSSSSVKSSSSSITSKSSSSIRSSSSSAFKSSSSASIKQAQCTYHVNSQWGNGFNAGIRVKNVSTKAIQGWSVNWKYTDGSSMTNGWNANVSGNNPYTASNMNWNATIQPGQTVEFGFNGKKPAGEASVPAVTGDVCH